MTWFSQAQWFGSLVGDFAIAYLVADRRRIVHVWSLAIEEQFSFVGRQSWSSLPCGTLSGCARPLVPARLGYRPSGGGDPLRPRGFFSPWGHMVALATGCLAAGLIRTRRTASIKPLVSSTTVAAAVILMVGVVCLWADQILIPYRLLGGVGGHLDRRRVPCHARPVRFAPGPLSAC